jgi:hypothetical protein
METRWRDLKILLTLSLSLSVSVATAVLHQDCQNLRRHLNESRAILVSDFLYIDMYYN